MINRFEFEGEPMFEGTTRRNEPNPEITQLIFDVFSVVGSSTASLEAKTEADLTEEFYRSLATQIIESLRKSRLSSILRVSDLKDGFSMSKIGHKNIPIVKAALGESTDEATQAQLFANKQVMGLQAYFQEHYFKDKKDEDKFF